VGGFDGDALDHFQTQFFHGLQFARVVGKQFEFSDGEVLQHGLADGVIAQIRSEAQRLVGFDRVRSLILQLVGLDLVEQADTAALLAQVEQRPAALLADGPERRVQLLAAVATHGKQGVAGQALAVNAGEYRLAVAHVSQGKHEVLLFQDNIFETVHIELAPPSGEARAFYVMDGH